MPCEILDIRCIFMNELIGNALLATIFLAVLYFIIASKIRLGFDATLVFAVPMILIVGISFGGFPALYAFITVILGMMIGWIFQSIIKN